MDLVIDSQINNRIPGPFLFANKAKNTLKDVNFLEINKYSKRKVCFFRQEDALYLKEVIKRDSEFLMSHGIMDYSLLLVTEKIKMIKG